MAQKWICCFAGRMTKCPDCIHGTPHEERVLMEGRVTKGITCHEQGRKCEGTRRDTKQTGSLNVFCRRTP